MFNALRCTARPYRASSHHTFCIPDTFLHVHFWCFFFPSFFLSHFKTWAFRCIFDAFFMHSCAIHTEKCSMFLLTALEHITLVWTRAIGTNGKHCACVFDADWKLIGLHLVWTIKVELDSPCLLSFSSLLTCLLSSFKIHTHLPSGFNVVVHQYAVQVSEPPFCAAFLVLFS